MTKTPASRVQTSECDRRTAARSASGCRRTSTGSKTRRPRRSGKVQLAPPPRPLTTCLAVRSQVARRLVTGTPLPCEATPRLDRTTIGIERILISAIDSCISHRTRLTRFALSRSINYAWRVLAALLISVQRLAAQPRAADSRFPDSIVACPPLVGCSGLLDGPLNRRPCAPTSMAEPPTNDRGHFVGGHSTRRGRAAKCL